MWIGDGIGTNLAGVSTDDYTAVRIPYDTHNTVFPDPRADARRGWDDAY